MSPDQKKQLKKEIKQTLKEIDNDLSYLKDVTKPISPENAIGRISRMDSINNMNINKNLLHTKEQQKQNYQKVLNIIDLDSFGICNLCKKDIPFKRILSVPDSKLCVPCIRNLNKGN